MSNTSKYQLFISNKCCCCDKVLTRLTKENILVPTVNIDKDKYELPFSLSILPALVKEKKLIGYGVDDIIRHLKNQL